MPRINLLPWRAEERQRRKRQFQLGLVAAVSAGFLVALLGSFVVGSIISGKRERNEYLRAQIAALDGDIKEIHGLEQQKQRLLARMEIIERLQRSRPEIVHVFDQLVRTLPDGVYLTSIQQNGRKLEVKGVAQSSTRVSTFMRGIEGSEWIGSPELKLIESKGTTAAGGAEFALTVMQKGLDPDEDSVNTGRKRRPGAKPGNSP